MEKDFNSWNKAKKILESIPITKYVHPREVWWCSLGINLGSEIDGKNENFERPVVIMKVYNRETMFVLPVTSKQKDDKFHYKIQTNNKIVWVKLTQARVVSNKRLSRKVDTIDELSFLELKKAWIESL